MADEYTVDHTSTPRDFKRVFSMSCDKEGRKLDIHNFDKDSPKPKWKLYEEALTRDAVLKHNPETKRLHRYARSAQNRIYELRCKKFWREVARSYPSGKFIDGERDYTTSETLKPWESPEEGSLRCYLEEMDETFKKVGYVPKASDLVPELNAVGRWAAKLDVHESRVYKGIISEVSVYWSDLYIDLHDSNLSLGEEIIIVKDADGEKMGSRNWVRTYLRPESYQQVP